MARVKCPKCRARLNLDDEHLGHEVDCGACGAVFVAQVEGGSPRREREDDDYERPSRRSRDDEDDEDFERPPRRPRRRRPQGRIEDAPGLVAGPANGLIWTGWLSALVCVFGGAAAAAFGYSQLNDPNAQQGDPELMLIIGLIYAVFGTPYGIVMAIGGHQMKQLRGTAWGYTAAGLGIATIVVGHVCCPLTWAGLLYGIRAIVVLTRPEVRNAIEANRDRDLKPELDDDRL